MTFEYRNSSTLIFAMVEKGMCFLQNDCYYLKIDEDIAIPIGYEKGKTGFYSLFETVEFDLNAEIEKIYNHVSITFD